MSKRLEKNKFFYVNQRLEKVRNKKQNKCPQTILLLPNKRNKMEKIKQVYISKYYSDYDSQVILLIVTDG